MNDKKNLWVWIGVAVVVVAVIVAVVVWFVNRGQAPQQAAVVPVVHAPAGQVIAGFPQQMILGVSTSSSATSGAASFFSGITDSYSIGYSTSTNQYTAEWVSSSTIAALYKQYQDYVTKNGFTIINHADTATLKSIYATNPISVVNIVITPQSSVGQNKGSKIIVSYVTN